MSICLELNSLSGPMRRKITNTLTFKGKKTIYNPEPVNKPVFSASKKDNAVYLPIRQYQVFLDQFPSSIKDYSRTKLRFNGNLFTKDTDPKGRGRDQDVVVAKTIKRMKQSHSAFVASFTGFGKTTIAIYIMTHFRLKTAILCHLDTVKQQWGDEIKKYCGDVHIQYVQGKKPLDPKADVYVFGIQKAASIDREQLSDIGLVIIDESHICTVTAFTKSLLRFQPMYLLGLSATPDRPDGMHQMLYPYFGPNKEFIVREETKDFVVVKYMTYYKPEISYSVVHGKTVPNWTKMMNSLSYNEDRQREIAKIILSEPKRKIIVLCGRKETATNIYDMLVEKKESVELLIGTKKTWDKTKRVLIAGMKKGGTGLDDPNLDMLVLEFD